MGPVGQTCSPVPAAVRGSPAGRNGVGAELAASPGAGDTGEGAAPAQSLVRKVSPVVLEGARGLRGHSASPPVMVRTDPSSPGTFVKAAAPSAEAGPGPRGAGQMDAPAAPLRGVPEAQRPRKPERLPSGCCRPGAWPTPPLWPRSPQSGQAGAVRSPSSGIGGGHTAALADLGPQTREGTGVERPLRAWEPAGGHKEHGNCSPRGSPDPRRQQGFGRRSFIRRPGPPATRTTWKHSGAGGHSRAQRGRPSPGRPALPPQGARGCLSQRPFQSRHSLGLLSAARACGGGGRGAS